MWTCSSHTSPCLHHQRGLTVTAVTILEVFLVESNSAYALIKTPQRASSLAKWLKCQNMDGSKGDYQQCSSVIRLELITTALMSPLKHQLLWCNMISLFIADFGTSFLPGVPVSDLFRGVRCSHSDFFVFTLSHWPRLHLYIPVVVFKWLFWWFSTKKPFFFFLKCWFNCEIFHFINFFFFSHLLNTSSMISLDKPAMWFLFSSSRNLKDFTVFAVSLHL